MLWVISTFADTNIIKSEEKTKGAQRALGRSPEEKAEGHIGTNNG